MLALLIEGEGAVLEDKYLGVLGTRFGRELFDREGQKRHMLMLYADPGCQSNLKENFKVEVVIAGDGLAFKTPLGDLNVEFVPALDGNACGWVAIFRDTDELGKSRDLCAFRLRVDFDWACVEGSKLPLDAYGDPTISTAIAMLRRAMAKKLQLTDERLAKI